MRLLHTSDWHLGRSFHGESLITPQHTFLDHLIDVVRAEDVDAVLVAGDIYDRALPSLDAIALFDEVLHRLADLAVPAVLISGNHDSARRLGVAAGLIDRARIHLRTDPAAAATPVLLHDTHGPVALYGLPYLEPTLVRDDLHADHASHPAVLGAALHRIRADLATRPRTRSVLLAHAFVTGGHGSDSERDLTVGGISHVGAAAFTGLDYVALGHLHRPQTLTDRLRYSGSPLAYSFSEATHRKTTTLIDLDATGQITAHTIDCPVPRRLARLRGPLDDLLTDPALQQHTTSWVQATLTDPHRPHDPMARLRRRFPHTLALDFQPDTPDPAAAQATYASRLRGRDDLQIGLDFIAHVRHRPADPAEAALLRQAFDAVRTSGHPHPHPHARPTP